MEDQPGLLQEDQIVRHGQHHVDTGVVNWNKQTRPGRASSVADLTRAPVADQR